MSGARILIMSVVVIATFLPMPANAQSRGKKSDAITPGGTFQGEIPTSAIAKSRAEWYTARGVEVTMGRLSSEYVATQVPITLKAGQSFTCSAVVTGTGRQVFLALINPAGRYVARNQGWGVKTTELQVEELSTSGTYKIEVWSDQVGSFTLKTASGSDGDDEDRDQLEAKIERLEQELATAKAKLKALKASSAVKKR
jgi:hypothetical protein